MEKNQRRYKTHIVFNVDLATRTATCAECGDVPLAFTPSREGNYPARGARTRITHGGKYTRRQYQLWKPGIELVIRRNKVHTILSYDTIALVGICVTCGKIPIKVWDSPSKRAKSISHVMCLYKHVTSHPTLMLSVSPDELLSAWHTTCDICATNFSATQPYYVDHNHTTGKFRGYLCISCNFLVGRLEAAQSELVKKAFEYIRSRG